MRNETGQPAAMICLPMINTHFSITLPGPAPGEDRLSPRTECILTQQTCYLIDNTLRSHR